jgi:hypothetical protein
VNEQPFSKAALVLLGHGTIQNPQSGFAGPAAGGRVRLRGIFAALREAF